MSGDPHLEEMRRLTSWLKVCTLAIVFLSVILILTMCCRGAEVAYSHSVADSVVWAAEVSSKLPAEDKPFVRFLYAPAHLTGDHTKALNYVVNSSVSKTSVLRFPQVYYGGWLISYDLRDFVKRDDDLMLEMLGVWDEVAAKDNQFYITENVLLTVKPYTHTDGKKYTQKWFSRSRFGNHVDNVAATLLMNNTRCRTPICRVNHFVFFASAESDFGFYYRFLLPDAVRNPKSGTQKESILKFLGADLEKSRNIDSDDRVAMRRSKVTGKPRVVRRVNTLAGEWFETLDQSDEQLKAGEQALLNLYDYEKRRFAEEIMYDLPNGLIGYLLFDKDGKLVAVVPQNVATDDTVPDPHSENLIPMISCLRCHAPDDGWKPCPNDILALNQKGLDIYDDFNAIKDGLTQREVVAELVALYGGEFTDILRLARDRIAKSVFLVTNGMKIGEVTNLLAGMYASEFPFEFVTPQQACAELGYIVEQEDAESTLKTLFITEANEKTGVRFEGFTPGTLSVGFEVNRVDFNRDYQEMAVRAGNFRSAHLSSKANVSSESTLLLKGTQP